MNIIDAVHKYRAPGRAWYQRSEEIIKYIAVHHTGNYHRNTSTDEQALKATYNVHVNGKGWQGLSYHYYIPKSGRIYKTNTHNDVTWTDGKNWNALAVCLDGHFGDGDYPTDAQIAALEWLLDFLTTQQPQFPAAQKDVMFHGEITPTSCCGKNLKQAVVNYRETGDLSKTAPQKTTINMPDNRYDNEVKQAQQIIERWKRAYPTLAAGYARARNDVDGPADWGELILNDIAEPLRLKGDAQKNEILQLKAKIKQANEFAVGWQNRATTAEDSLRNYMEREELAQSAVTVNTQPISNNSITMTNNPNLSEQKQALQAQLNALEEQEAQENTPNDVKNIENFTIKGLMDGIKKWFTRLSYAAIVNLLLIVGLEDIVSSDIIVQIVQAIDVIISLAMGLFLDYVVKYGLSQINLKK